MRFLIFIALFLTLQTVPCLSEDIQGLTSPGVTRTLRNAPAFQGFGLGIPHEFRDVARLERQEVRKISPTSPIANLIESLESDFYRGCACLALQKIPSENFKEFEEAILELSSRITDSFQRAATICNIALVPADQLQTFKDKARKIAPGEENSFFKAGQIQILSLDLRNQGVKGQEPE